MELIDRLSTAVFLVFATVFFGFLVVHLIIDAIRGTDLRRFEAMRATDPQSFRRIVGVCRWNGGMVVGLGVMLSIGGLSTALSGLVAEPVDLQAALGGVGMSALGVGLTWFALRWCRWAWRTKLD